jgi:short-subunit dehydrogenase
MDVTDYVASRKTMEDLAQAMGGFDIAIINAGVGFPKATFEQEIETVHINVRGFLALANWSYQYFQQKGQGHLVGVSSLAALSGSAYSPEYHASKAFMANYMSGLRMRSAKYKHSITITDIRPGFVDTPMTKQNKGMFWVATPEKAAIQIAAAVTSKQKIAYITKRYILIAIVLKIIPEWLLAKVF